MLSNFLIAFHSNLELATEQYMIKNTHYAYDLCTLYDVVLMSRLIKNIKFTSNFITDSI